MANVARVRTLIAELDKLSKEYIAARDDYESARQVFEAAKEKLVAVRKVAPEVLGAEWHTWTLKHPEIRLVGLEMGAAIISVLQGKAYSSAIERVKSLNKPEGEQKQYEPSMSPSEISDALDTHGFEFRTGTPRREVHAALLNLKGITKVDREWGTEYQIEEHATIYRSMREAYGFSADEEQESADEEPSLFEKEGEPSKADDDVRF